MKFLYTPLIKLCCIVLCVLLFTSILTLVCWDTNKHFKGIDEESDKTWLQKFGNRFYFSTVTASSTGYGDVVPVSFTARAIVIGIIIVMLLNVISILEPMVYLRLLSKRR